MWKIIVNNHGNVPLGKSLNIYSDKGVTFTFSIIIISIQRYFFIPPFYLCVCSCWICILFFVLSIFSVWFYFCLTWKEGKLNTSDTKVTIFFRQNLFCCCCHCLLGEVLPVISATRILIPRTNNFASLLWCFAKWQNITDH